MGIDQLVLHGWILEGMRKAEGRWREDPQDSLAWANLIYVKSSAGFFDEALRLCELRTEFDLDDEVIAHGKARVLYMRGEFRAAIAIYESLVAQSYPFQAQQGLFWSFVKSKRFAEALSLLEQMVEEDCRSAYGCRAAVEFAERMRLFRVREVLVEALGRLPLVSDKEPTPPELFARASDAALDVVGSGPSPLQRLNALSRLGDLTGEDADLESREIVDQQPHFYYSHFIRGRVMFERRDFAQSAASFDRACELRPTDSQSFYFAANAYAQAKRWDLAELRGEQALGMDPLNDWIVTLMRKIYKRSFRLKLAWNNESAYLKLRDECKLLEPRFEANVVKVILDGVKVFAGSEPGYGTST